MWALDRLDDCTKQEGLGPQYTRMKASWAGEEALASAVWLLWMARYTEYSMIFPDVTEGGSQVKWAPSGLWGKNQEAIISSYSEQHLSNFPFGGGVLPCWFWWRKVLLESLVGMSWKQKSQRKLRDHMRWFQPHGTCMPCRAAAPFFSFGCSLA